MQQSVPTSFQDMFCFNAAAAWPRNAFYKASKMAQVMGLEDREWMYEILKSFDASPDSFAQHPYRISLFEDVFGGLKTAFRPRKRLNHSSFKRNSHSAEDREERLELLSLARGVRRDLPTLREGVLKHPIVRV